MKTESGAGSQVWKMVKADLLYNKTLFFILYAVFLTFALFNVIYGRMERFMLQVILISVGMIGIFAGSEEVKTRGTRRIILVPVSIGRISVMRQAILVGYVFSLMGIVVSSSLLAGKGWPEPGFVLRVITMTGLLFIITSLMDIFFNLKFLTADPGVSIIIRGLALIAAMAAVVVYMLFMNIVGKRQDWLVRTLTTVFVSPQAAMLVLAVGLGLVVLTMAVFRARKRFTE
jgi:hypothetical protein